MAEEAVPEAGWVTPELREELPGLALRYLLIDGGSGRTPRHLKERLSGLSNRFSGPQAINLRHQPIPWAYRVFYRHIGLDPDEQQTPVEAVALERMKRGGFISRSLLDDALTIAIIESGVALRAFDADRAQGRLGIRQTQPGEALEGRPGSLPVGHPGDRRRGQAAGAAVRRDRRRPRRAARGRSARLLAAVQVKGVPDIAVEEAIWLAADVLRS